MHIYIYTIAKIHLEGSQWLRDPLAAHEHRCSYVHVAFFRASFCGPPSVRPLACAVFNVRSFYKAHLNVMLLISFACYHGSVVHCTGTVKGFVAPHARISHGSLAR